LRPSGFSITPGVNSCKRPFEILQVEYLNNMIEQDHRFIKNLTRPIKGFKSFGLRQPRSMALRWPIWSEGGNFQPMVNPHFNNSPRSVHNFAQRSPFPPPSQKFATKSMTLSLLIVDILQPLTVKK
jgi:hypothetical protein